MFKTILLTLSLALAIATLAACGGNETPTATPVPATPAPTAQPPSAEPTVIPPTAAPPTSVPPSTVPSASPTGSTGAADPLQALANVQAASNFRLETRAQVSPLFFQGKYTPGPGDDPQTVNILSVKGEEKTPDSHYAYGGFIGSFLAVSTGLDPQSGGLELAIVGGKKFVKGTRTGESQAQWFELSAEQAATIQSNPRALLLPIAGMPYQPSDFERSATETLDAQSCTVYRASRSAFDAALAAVSEILALRTDKLDAGAVDRYDFRIWVCGDGLLHQVRYTFDAHDKTAADQKGTFTYLFQIRDYDAVPAIQAPTGAVPLSGGAPTPAPLTPTARATAQHTPTPTARAAAPAKPTSSAAPQYDGEWQGTSSTDSPIAFTVENNRITNASLNYVTRPEGCSAQFSGSRAGTVADAPIAGNQFTVQVGDADLEFTLNGKFTSSAEASGTLHLKGKFDCGAVDTDFTWSAKKNPPAESGASPTEESTPVAPPSEPTAAPLTGDALDTVNAFFQAVSDGNYDAALALVADDVAYNIGPQSGVGKNNLLGVLAQGVTYITYNFEATGDAVNFAARASDDTIYNACAALLSNGKIQVLTIK